MDLAYRDMESSWDSGSLSLFILNILVTVNDSPRILNAGVVWYAGTNYSFFFHTGCVAMTLL